MGATGSGPQHNPNSERSRAKGIAGVVGTGEPTLPDDKIPPEVIREWTNLVDLTAGVSFEQDSDSLLQLARLRIRQRKLEALLDSDPGNVELNKLSLSIVRQTMALSVKFGLTPKDRQVIVRPKKEEDKPKSRFEQLRESNATFSTSATE